MQLGMVGLGRMGANMTERLTRGGHQVVGFDLSPDAVKRVIDAGAAGAGSLPDLVAALDRRGRCGSWCPTATRSTR